MRNVDAVLAVSWIGDISPNFHWSDPDDSNDPVVILKREGVSFLPNGKADPSDRIHAEELVILLDDLDIDDLIQGAGSDD